jgi:hypothetical protein
MANRSRMTGIALVALAVALPAYSGAQEFTAQNVNGTWVYSRAGAGWSQRAVQVQYGWYYETVHYGANARVVGMEFSYPQWQASDLVHHVRDTDGDGVMDYGWTWTIATQYVPWAPTEIASFKSAVDQARVAHSANIGKQHEVIYLMFVTRADKMYEAAGQMIRARRR